MNSIQLISCLFAFICVSLAQDAKTFTFAVNGNRRPFNFIDDTGVLIGADLDLINEVCRLAAKKCAVTVQPTEECVRTVRDRFYPGVGIMAGWFDVCTSYVSSYERENALDFTKPHRTIQSTFAVVPGNPKGFDTSKIASSTIVQLNGAFTNQQCLTRLGLGTPKRMIVASGIVEATALMLNMTGDALFSQRTMFRDLDVLPDRFQCAKDGVAMMVKKGSPIPTWWNPAFDQFYQSGNYTKWCSSINKKYGGLGNATKGCLLPPKPVKPIPTNGISKSALLPGTLIFVIQTVLLCFRIPGSRLFE